MIKGIGTDIVDIDRIATNIEKHGEKFAERILSKKELEFYNKTNMKAQFIASRFAAKEAVAKALGTGFREGLFMHDITVLNDTLGKPYLEFAGKAKEMVEERSVSESHLSIAHERHTTVAFVILT